MSATPTQPRSWYPWLPAADTTVEGALPVDSFVRTLADVVPVSGSPGAAPYRFDTGDPDQDLFTGLYLTKRDGAIPEHLVSDGASSSVEQDIRVMLASVFNEVRAELDLRLGREESH